MSIVPLHADARASAPVAARSKLVERRLEQFQPQVRARVRAVAERHPHLADLALSFPALLFALALPRAGYARERVCEQVIAGAPLRDVALATGIPFWLRKLPPEGFEGPIPVLPSGDMFNRQIVNHVPKSVRSIAGWLNAIAEATALADDVAGLWVAREWSAQPKRRHIHGLRWISLWSWYARHVPDDPCKLQTAWQQTLGLQQASNLAEEWRQNVKLYLELGDGALADNWLAAANVGGFDFVPLSTFADIRDEALAMKHCVRTYARYLTENSSRVWSIRRDGERVATLELCLSSQAPFPNIVQIKMQNNERAPEGIWRSARAWLQSDWLRPFNLRYDCEDAPVNLKAWQTMWRPYWLAKRRVPAWLPLAPSRDLIDDL